MMSVKTKQFSLIATVILFVLSTVWLLGPHVNHILGRGPNMVSEYESIGMPYAYLFRVSDGLAAVLLILSTLLLKKDITKYFHRKVMYVLFLVGCLQIVDVLIPLQCKVTLGVCAPIINTLAVIHGVESFIVSTCVVLLALYLTWKRRRDFWVVPAMLFTSLVGYLLHASLDSLLFGLQTTSLLLTCYVLWSIVLRDSCEAYVKTLPLKRLRLVVTGLVYLAAFSGILTVVFRGEHHHYVQFRLLQNSAWVSQHILIVSLVLLYLGRALYQGSVNAWRIVTILVFSEILQSATFGRSYFATLIYIILFAILLGTQSAFTLGHGIAKFKTRVQNALLVLLVTTIVAAFISVAFRLLSVQQWNISAFSPLRVISRVLLFEVSSDGSDPLRARIFGQMLTAIGFSFYGWLCVGLFSPRSLSIESSTKNKQDVEKLLAKYSNTSEDYFKVWPLDKKYWWSKKYEACVAYKESGSYVFALADPVCKDNIREVVLLEFGLEMRRRGYKVVWIMINETSLPLYHKLGYPKLPIGASAKVSISQFCTSTIRNKWWRWKRNKTTKAGYVYEALSPPYSSILIETLENISHEWLQIGGHEERGFALGYFDKTEIQTQRLHILKDETGSICAFANQLPTYGKHKGATIDMMRYRPAAGDVIAFLLSETICKLGEEGEYTHFDLGFVPLAKIESGTYKKAVFQALRGVLSPVFSSKGLEQFKSRFEPEWNTQFVAFDGDMIDVVSIVRRLNAVMKVK